MVPVKFYECKSYYYTDAHEFLSTLQAALKCINFFLQQTPTALFHDMPRWWATTEKQRCTYDVEKRSLYFGNIFNKSNYFFETTSGWDRLSFSTASIFVTAKFKPALYHLSKKRAANFKYFVYSRRYVDLTLKVCIYLRELTEIFTKMLYH